MSFPMSEMPSVSWHENPRGTHFGAVRTGKYPGAHPACDLVAPAGTAVLAVYDGVVIRGPYAFASYEEKDETGKIICQSTTFAIEVRHQGFIARYCEISPHLPNCVAKGVRVSEGEKIAEVGFQCGGSMLHFEMYQDTGRLDDLTQENNTTYLYVPKAKYRRRSDLLDPTWFLDEWAGLNRPKKLHETEYAW